MTSLTNPSIRSLISHFFDTNPKPKKPTPSETAYTNANPHLYTGEYDREKSGNCEDRGVVSIRGTEGEYCGGVVKADLGGLGWWMRGDGGWTCDGGR